MSKKSSFKGCFEKQYVKRAQTLLKSASQHLCLIHWSLGRNLFSTKSLLLTCQILGLLPNTLAADEKYPVLNRDNLTILIQIQFSQKQKSFLDFLLHFLNVDEILNISKKKDDPHRFCISEAADYENVVRQILKSPVSKDPSTSNIVNVLKHC